MKNIKLIINYLSKTGYYVLLFFLLFIAAIAILANFKNPWGLKLYVVQSGSMEPSIHVGSVVLVKAQTDYRVGDIVTFAPSVIEASKSSAKTTTHRIVEANKVDNLTKYTTKGDANKVSDLTLIVKEQILGKVVFPIIVLGSLISFTKTLPGLIAIVIIPATIIVYSEIVNIKNEALRLVKERRVRKLNPKEQIEEKIGEEIIAVEKELKKQK